MIEQERFFFGEKPFFLTTMRAHVSFFPFSKCMPFVQNRFRIACHTLCCQNPGVVLFSYLSEETHKFCLVRFSGEVDGKGGQTPGRKGGDLDKEDVSKSVEQTHTLVQTL